MVLGVQFYYFLFTKAMGLTKIIPNIDNKQLGDGTSYREERGSCSADSFFFSPLRV